MRGGKRINAGRRVGTQNLVSQNLRERILAEGISPLEYMVAVMRDTSQEPAIRMDAAKAVAPFIHPKLQSIEYASKDEVGPPPCVEIVFVAADPKPLDLPVLKHEPPTLHIGQSVWEEPEPNTFIPKLF
jgi:hypothetical protein